MDVINQASEQKMRMELGRFMHVFDSFISNGRPLTVAIQGASHDPLLTNQNKVIRKAARYSKRADQASTNAWDDRVDVQNSDSSSSADSASQNSEEGDGMDISLGPHASLVEVFWVNNMCYIDSDKKESLAQTVSHVLKERRMSALRKEAINFTMEKLAAPAGSASTTNPPDALRDFQVVLDFISTVTEAVNSTTQRQVWESEITGAIQSQGSPKTVKDVLKDLGKLILEYLESTLHEYREESKSGMLVQSDRQWLTSMKKLEFHNSPLLKSLFLGQGNMKILIERIVKLLRTCNDELTRSEQLRMICNDESREEWKTEYMERIRRFQLQNDAKHIKNLAEKMLTIQAYVDNIVDEDVSCDVPVIFHMKEKYSQ